MWHESKYATGHLNPDPRQSENHDGEPVHETSAYPKRFAKPPRARQGEKPEPVTNHPSSPNYKPPVNKEAIPALSTEMPKEWVEKKAARPHEDEEEDPVKKGVPDATNRNKEDAEIISTKQGKGQKLPEDLAD